MIEWIILGNRSLGSWQQTHAMMAILDELVRHFDDELAKYGLPA
jgi:hypothetical protein